MKRVQFLFVAILSIALFSFYSCNKSEDDLTADKPLLSAGTITLKVDGTSWNASLAVQGINTSGVINVTGSDSDAKQASLILYGVTEPGTYTFGLGTSHQLRWTEGLGQTDTYMANGLVGSGTIIVTELSTTKIKGSFSFTGMNTAQATKSITDGSFEATF